MLPASCFLPRGKEILLQRCANGELLQVGHCAVKLRSPKLWVWKDLGKVQAQSPHGLPGRGEDWPRVLPEHHVQPLQVRAPPEYCCEPSRRPRKGPPRLG